MITRMIRMVPSVMASSLTAAATPWPAAPAGEEKHIAAPGSMTEPDAPQGLFGFELQRRGIDAVAQARRPRAVGEDMTEMAAALGAQHLGADHAVTDVPLLIDMALGGGLGEARPAAAGIELRVGLEQHIAAAGAGIGTGAVVVLIFAGEGTLGRLLAQHRVLHRRQLVAPLLFALDDLVVRGFRLGVGHGSPVFSVNLFSVILFSDLAISWWPCWRSPASASRYSYPRTAFSGSRPSVGRCRRCRAGSGAASDNPGDRPPPDRTPPARRPWSRSAY